MPPEEVIDVLLPVKECERIPNAKWVKHTSTTHLARRECPHCGNFQVIEICTPCVESIESHHRLDAKWNCLKCHRKLDTNALVVIGRV